MRLGWIGTGLMGAPMVRRLLEADREVSVHARRADSAAPLLAAGADWADSPQACGESCETVFLMLPDATAVREVLTGEAGLLRASRPPDLVVDMSTIGPHAATALATDAASAGSRLLDAPVSGGPIGAEQGTLAIMVGGEQSDFERVHDHLDVLGHPIYLGPAGAGQTAKLVNQTIIAGTMAGVAEAFALAHRSGLNLDDVLAVLQQGIAGSRLLSFAWPRLLGRDFAPGFKISHMTKDLDLVVEAGRSVGLELPIAAEVLSLYRHLVAGGGSSQGTQALVQAVDDQYGGGVGS